MRIMSVLIKFVTTVLKYDLALCALILCLVGYNV